MAASPGPNPGSPALARDRTPFPAPAGIIRFSLFSSAFLCGLCVENRHEASRAGIVAGSRSRTMSRNRRTTTTKAPHPATSRHIPPYPARTRRARRLAGAEPRLEVRRSAALTGRGRRRPPALSHDFPRSPATSRENLPCAPNGRTRTTTRSRRSTGARGRGHPRHPIPPCPAISRQFPRESAPLTHQPESEDEDIGQLPTLPTPAPPAIPRRFRE